MNGEKKQMFPFDFFGEHIKKIGAVSFVLTVVIVGYFSYRAYFSLQQRAAHKTFLTCLKYYEGTVSPDKEKKITFDEKKIFSSPQEKWQEVERVCMDGYKKHAHSGLASMFLAFAAEGLAKQDKLQEAIDILKKSIAVMPNDSLKSFYEVKLALLYFDLDEHRKTKEKSPLNRAPYQEGLALLKKIAYEEHNPAQDLALYHLGLLYWHKDFYYREGEFKGDPAFEGWRRDFTSVRNYWNQLKLKFGRGTKMPSPWYEEIKNKLKLLQ